MTDSHRAPLLPVPLLRLAKTLFGVMASLVAVLGGVAAFAVAVGDLWSAFTTLLAPAPTAGATPITYVIKSVDALLLAMIQLLLAAFLWNILDPATSLIAEATTERVEQVKQMLSKVILVILAVRFLELGLGSATFDWTLLVLVAGILAMALASSLLSKGKG